MYRKTLISKCQEIFLYILANDTTTGKHVNMNHTIIQKSLINHKLKDKKTIARQTSSFYDKFNSMKLAKTKPRLRHSSMALLVAYFTALPTLFLPSVSLSKDFNLPDLGDSSVSVISPSEEIVIGKKFMQQAYSSLPYIIDPEVEAYLVELGKTLTDSIPNNNVQFQFYLVNAPVINAFAVPGGHITLFSGLFIATEDENELTSVVAHEITHVTQKHLPRMIAQSKQSTIPTAAAVLGGILLGGQAGAAAIMSANAAAIENQLSYNRAFESEADSIGMQLMAKSGYDPNGMAAFFNVLQSNSRLAESRTPEYLRTHPLTLSRVSEAQLRAQQYPSKNVASSKDYYFMREKIRAYSPGVDKTRLVEQFKARLHNQMAYPDAIRFGYAYALMNNKKYDLAHENAQMLLDKEPSNPYYHNLQAQIYADQGNLQRATDVMAAAVAMIPNNIPLQKDYADLLVRAGKNREALDVLNNLLVYTPSSSYLYEKAAKAYSGLGDNFNTHLHLADFYTLRGGYDRANEQLDLASRYVGDSYFNQTLIDTKRKQVITEKTTMQNSKL